MIANAFDLAQRYVGVMELGPAADHPLIVWWLSLCNLPKSLDVDETPWCSAFINGLAWEMRLPRTKSAAARSWLTVGRPITIEEAQPESDVVILSRDGGGHVGLFAGLERNNVLLLGGNQHDSVNVSPFARNRVIGVRRLG